MTIHRQSALNARYSIPPVIELPFSILLVAQVLLVVDLLLALENAHLRCKLKIQTLMTVPHDQLRLLFTVPARGYHS